MSRTNDRLPELFEAANSLAWLGMDAAWLNGWDLTALGLGGVALVSSLSLVLLYKEAADRCINAACVLWVLMDLSWVIDSHSDAYKGLHVTMIFCGLTGVAMLVSWIVSSLNRPDYVVGRDSWGLVNTLAWFAMDAAWLFNIQTGIFYSGVLTLVSGAVVFGRSRNTPERFVNAAMCTWIVMDMSQFMGELSDKFSGRGVDMVLFAATLVLLVPAVGMSDKRRDVMACFRRVRFWAHARTKGSFTTDPATSSLRVDPTPQPPQDAASEAVRATYGRLGLVAVEQGGTLELRAEGRIDPEGGEKLAETVFARADAGARNIVLEASKVEYLSSAGLRSLLRCKRRLASSGGIFKISNPSDAFMRVVFMAGLESML